MTEGEDYMLLDFSVRNFKVFQNEIKFSMIGNKKIVNDDNIWKINNMDIVKSSIIYGPNNTGKSTFIEAVASLKEMIKDGSVNHYANNYALEIVYNFFNEDKKLDYHISFISDNDIYDYALSFGIEKKITKEILKVNNKVIFDNNATSDNEEIMSMINIQESYPEKLIVTMLPGNSKKYSDAIKDFFDKMIIIDDGYDMDEIYSIILNYTNEEKKILNNIIKDADISIDNLKIDDVRINDDKYNKFKIVSSYKMNNRTKSMPSVISDSKGTKMFLYYIVKIINLRKTGGIIFIDEIDSSLHTLLVKEILNLFNNENNTNMQLVVTSHDLMLLDCRYTFRKDQVWFTYKDEDDVYFYSLDEFKNHESTSIRNDILKGYLKGMFGALPKIDIEKDFYEEE